MNQINWSFLGVFGGLMLLGAVCLLWLMGLDIKYNPGDDDRYLGWATKVALVMVGLTVAAAFYIQSHPLVTIAMG